MAMTHAFPDYPTKKSIRDALASGMIVISYVSPDYRTKKALKDALASGATVLVYNPGPFLAPRDGKIYLEGPHYPKPPKWYASGIVKDGRLISIK